MSSGPPFIIDDWEKAAAAARKQLFDSIPKKHLLPLELSARIEKSGLLPDGPAVLGCGILSPLELEITRINNAAVLVSRIADQTYSALQVTEAFCKRASIAQQTTNCLTLYLYHRAIKRAQYLDQYLEKEGKTVGILHGIPVSLKDIFGMHGHPTTNGLVSWLPNISQEDCMVLKNLEAAGAVIHAKTNVSQANLMVESINNIFGTAKNPHNLALSAGGSSGGEAALLASRGSVLGSAVDGGGSIRFPAACCGVWGLKCSKNRISGIGMMGVDDGNESVNVGIGPMAHSVSSLELWLRAQLDPRPWDVDTACIPMPWNLVEAGRCTKRLRVGVIWDDGVVKPCPPVTRALQKMVGVLKAENHELIDLPPEIIKSIHRRGLSCVMKSNVQSGGYHVSKQFEASGEPILPRTAVGSTASFLTTSEVFANHKTRAGLAAEYNALWAEYRLDTILCPSMPHPAPPHGTYVSNAYSTIYNMLDYVAGCIPVTETDCEMDIASEEWYRSSPYPRIEPNRFPYDWGDAEMKELYKGPHVYKNGPVGLQMLCRPLREEKMISILKEIEHLLATAKEG